ncbi:MAG: hypothetical protein NTV35_04095, partial [Chloroflexi bacterium]|nr:hypothetical protein [Chloroflexota bacterium]
AWRALLTAACAFGAETSLAIGLSLDTTLGGPEPNAPRTHSPAQRDASPTYNRANAPVSGSVPACWHYLHDTPAPINCQTQRSGEPSCLA